MFGEERLVGESAPIIGMELGLKDGNWDIGRAFEGRECHTVDLLQARGRFTFIVCVYFCTFW